MSSPPALPPARTWQTLVELALREDLGSGDATTPLVIEEDRAGAARIEARQGLVVCGLAVVEAVFREVDPRIAFHSHAREGARVEAGRCLAVVAGPLRAILAGERTALNFLARLCGVATWTRRFVDAVDGAGVGIVDTRKTVPGWRALDKYATSVGGALNHRAGLFDGILLKDNHVALAGGVAAAFKAARAAAPAGLRIQLEVESEVEARAAVEAGADFLLIDNCAPAEIRRIVEQLAGRALLEVSGGITLENVRAIAETGVQRVSIGALTHSAPAADVALEIEREGPATGAAGQ
ncbi:MAG: carboxylating nicotinate-nucleotide diphosphorylase [Myxococcota bacterium]